MVVEEAAIAVFCPLDGPNPGAIGVAVRNGRRLTDELDEALADLQDLANLQDKVSLTDLR